EQQRAGAEAPRRGQGPKCPTRGVEWSLGLSSRAKLETVRRLRDEEEHNWDVLSRPAQREPDGEWSMWALLGGRGAGKTRALSEAHRRRGKARPLARVGGRRCYRCGCPRRHDRGPSRDPGVLHGRRATAV